MAFNFPTILASDLGVDFEWVKSEGYSEDTRPQQGAYDEDDWSSVIRVPDVRRYLAENCTPFHHGVFIASFCYTSVDPPGNQFAEDLMAMAAKVNNAQTFRNLLTMSDNELDETVNDLAFVAFWLSAIKSKRGPYFAYHDGFERDLSDLICEKLSTNIGLARKLTFLWLRLSMFQPVETQILSIKSYQICLKIVTDMRCPESISNTDDDAYFHIPCEMIYKELARKDYLTSCGGMQSQYTLDVLFRPLSMLCRGHNRFGTRWVTLRVLRRKYMRILPSEYKDLMEMFPVNEEFGDLFTKIDNICGPDQLDEIMDVLVFDRIRMKSCTLTSLLRAFHHRSSEHLRKLNGQFTSLFDISGKKRLFQDIIDSLQKPYMAWQVLISNLLMRDDTEVTDWISRQLAALNDDALLRHAFKSILVVSERRISTALHYGPSLLVKERDLACDVLFQLRALARQPLSLHLLAELTLHFRNFLVLTFESPTSDKVGGLESEETQCQGRIWFLYGNSAWETTSRYQFQRPVARYLGLGENDLPVIAAIIALCTTVAYPKKSVKSHIHILSLDVLRRLLPYLDTRNTS